MSLYQKYRPKDWKSLVGQTFVKEALSYALANDRTVGGYLFYGSRGTGKTTVARIFAKAVNCQNLGEDGNPCDVCPNCVAFNEERMIDVIEIDAASNNGVDHIRDIIERSRFAPSAGKYKVYIVDEVHMLSRPAFNALLKTLEEPPAHVKFVLATTDAHKVPETIVSRVQRYDFRRISESDIADRLRFVAKEEGIDAEDEAVAIVAKLARGGLRDALTLFEQFVMESRITGDYVRNRLGLVGEEFMRELERAVSERDGSKIFELSAETLRRTDPMKFVDELLSYLRDRIAEVGVRSPEFPLLSDFFESISAAYPRARMSPDPMFVIETTIAKVAYGPVARVPYDASAESASRKANPPRESAPATRQPPVSRVAEPVPNTPAPEPRSVSESDSSEIPGASEVFSEPLPPEPPAFAEDPFFDAPPTPKPKAPKKSLPSAEEPATEKTADSAPPATGTSGKASSAVPDFGDAVAAPSFSEPPPFSFVDLVSHLKSLSRSALLVAAVKNATKAGFVGPSTFSLRPKNSIEAAHLSKPESRAAIASYFEKDSGRAVDVRIEAP